MLKKKYVHKYKKQAFRLLKILNKCSRKSIYLKKKIKNFSKIITAGNFSHQINLKLTQNNIFCTLRDIRLNKNILFKSAGSYKLNISKKNLKFFQKIIIQNFLDEVLRKVKLDTLLIIITAPTRIKKRIIKNLKTLAKNIIMVIKVNHLKIFNGCRPKKKKEKNRRD